MFDILVQIRQTKQSKKLIKSLNFSLAYITNMFTDIAENLQRL